MPYTTTNLGLVVWNNGDDNYDHSQQAENWAKLDTHDHTPGRGVPIPVDGIADGAITIDKLDPTLAAQINSLARAHAIAAPEVSTTSTSYVDLGGPSVSVVVPANAYVNLYVVCDLKNTTGDRNGVAGLSENGGTPFYDAIFFPPTTSYQTIGIGSLSRAGFMVSRFPATPGTYTYSLLYKVTGGTAGDTQFRNRNIFALVEGF